MDRSLFRLSIYISFWAQLLEGFEGFKRLHQAKRETRHDGVHRFGGLSIAFYMGKARTAMVDEGSMNMNGGEAWMRWPWSSDP